MERLLYKGRRIWFINKVDTVPAYVAGPFEITGFKQFLPTGPYESLDGIRERKHSLVQIYTDPGGLRTLAVATIRLTDPRRARE